MAKRLGHVEVYKDRAGAYRWRKVAGNGRKTANPGEGYTRRWNATKAAERACPGLDIWQFSRTSAVGIAGPRR